MSNYEVSIITPDGKKNIIDVIPADFVTSGKLCNTELHEYYIESSETHSRIVAIVPTHYYVKKID